MGLGYIAKAYPKILANEHFQRFKDIAMKRFGSTFLQLNLTNSDLQQNASSVIKDVFSNTNKLQMVQEILKQYSASQVLRLSVNDSVNGICYSDSMDFIDSLMNMSPWSVKMFDSIGKLSDGILDGHLNMVGSFDECNKVHAYIPKGTVLGNKTKQTDRSFNGRYCTVKMNIPQEVLAMDTKGIQLHLTWGLCIPDSCQHNDVKGLLSTEALKKIAPFLGSVSVHCSEEKSVSDDPSAITAMSFDKIFDGICYSSKYQENRFSKGRTKRDKLYSWSSFPQYNMGFTWAFIELWTVFIAWNMDHSQSCASAGDAGNFYLSSCLINTPCRRFLFMISGMLVAYSQINSASRLMDNFSCSKTAAFAGKYIFHRFWRLTPLYMIVIMVLTCLMNYFGDGPFWPSALPLADNCRTNWWANLLYINNFLPAVNQCMSWSWFLSDDMQFYVMTLFVLIFFAVSMKIGLVLISMLMIGGMSAAAYSEHTYKGDLLHGKEDNDVYWTNVYTPPWCRVSAYCVGLFLGIIMKKRPRKQLNWIQAVIGWTLATAGGLFVVYIPYTYYRKGGTPWSIDVKSAYESLARPLWASCVAWVVFACHNGNGGVVNKILSWRGLVPLSRLSYAVYLIHPIVMMTHFYSRRTLFYISDFNVVYLYIGHTVVSFMVAFVASLAFESSFLSLEKIIMGR